MPKVDQIKEKFNEATLFEQALTHRSWINENPGIRGTNERLEFLGDAVLEFIVSEEIYKKLEGKEEGYLTALRASLVNTQNLSQVAINLGIGEYLYLSKGEDDGGGRTNPSLLADTVEAIIGAIYLDLGMDAVKEFIHENILSNVDQKIKEPLKDPKSRLQELVQSKGLSTPRYQVLEESGPDHAKTFLVGVTVDKNSLGKGTGKSKSEAEQEAAADALKNMAQA